MSTARRYAPHYTIDDYVTWEGDWELWDGIAIAMSPGPFGRHQMTVANLLHEIRKSMEKHDCQARVVHEMDWIVRRDTVVRPDLVVVCGKIPERHLESAPAMVIEVLSDATRDRDKTYKRELYENEGVAFYWMVDPDTETTELLARSESDRWQLQPTSTTIKITVCDDCPIEINAADIFKR